MFVLAGDIDGDGHRDLVAGGWWWKNPGSLGASWSRRILGEPLRNMAALYDFDGDLEVVIGEHRGKKENRVVLFENISDGAMWKQHVINKGLKNTVDHHDGTQAVDLDGDGDLDIISIGWYNPKVWVYENK